MDLKTFNALRLESYSLLINEFPNLDISFSGENVIVVCEEYINIIEIVGLLKSHFSTRNFKILTRGQKNQHKFTQNPNIFRSVENFSLYKNIKSLYDKNFELLCKLSTKYKLAINYSLLEPLIQHFSVPTHWLDLVDNLPITLWFSINNDVSNESIFLKKLKENKSTKMYFIDRKNDIDPYSYVFIHAINIQNQISSGYWSSDYQYLIDLRESFPPISRRPHVQHAYLMSVKDIFYKIDNEITKSENKEGLESVKSIFPPKPIPNPYQKDRLPIESDYSFSTLVILKIRKENIEKWIGNGEIFSNEIIFPQEVNNFINKLDTFEELAKAIYLVKDDRINNGIKIYIIHKIFNLFLELLLQKTENLDKYFEELLSDLSKSGQDNIPFKQPEYEYIYKPIMSVFLNSLKEKGFIELLKNE